MCHFIFVLKNTNYDYTFLFPIKMASYTVYIVRKMDPRPIYFGFWMFDD